MAYIPYPEGIGVLRHPYKYQLNKLTPKMIYRFNDKFGAVIKYTSFITDYDKDVQEDSNENRGDFDLFYNLNSKTSFDLNYQIWERDYEKATVDYTSNQVMLSVTRSGKYFSLTAGAGYHDRNFDESTVDDFDTFSWQIILTGQNPPEKTDLPRSSILVALSENFNDAGMGDTYYTATRFTAKVTHLFMEKLNCTLNGYYQKSDYETSSRDDDVWFLSTGVDYFINDFFTIGLEGGFEKRNSNLSGRDYDNEYIMCNAAFHYDLGAK
ncbi:MAG: outer membrane beta-barrel protein [Thermodesulfobacteriota bacterium]|nr:outer membrane beta-barrel protein [Thermodesulfobacteriota bacterium]